MDEIYKNMLDIESFTHMLDDTTECYKFYWMDSLLDLLSRGVETICFDDVVNGMIASAWYSVSEYHLHLGPKNSSGNIMNSLERAVKKLIDAENIEKYVSEAEVYQIIARNEKLIHGEKMQMAKMVPYRILSSFFEDIKGNDEIWNQQKRMIFFIEMMNKKKRLPYIIGDAVGLKKLVVMDEVWKKMMLDNFVQIKGWIKVKKIKYLQDRNPSVPGIIYKLEPENEKLRKLKYVRELWSTIIEEHPVIDIYSGKNMQTDTYDVDHFVPWTYIANDELWNLMPTDCSLNRSKSNKLPNWKEYFIPFAANQYMLYDFVFNQKRYISKFKNCQRDNLIDIWANEELYIPNLEKQQFMGILEQHLKPIYDSARVQGYSIWNF